MPITLPRLSSIFVRSVFSTSWVISFESRIASLVIVGVYARVLSWAS